MFNSAAMFERMFIPTEGGFLFYPSAWSRGYLITADERDMLVEDWRSVAGFVGILKFVAIVIVVVILATIISTYFGARQEAMSIVTFVMAGLMVGYMLWRYSKVYRLIWGREPVAAKRTKDENRKHMGRMLGWPTAIFLASLATAWSGFFMWVAIEGSWIAGVIGLVLAVSAYAHWRIVIRKWQARRE